MHEQTPNQQKCEEPPKFPSFDMLTKHGAIALTVSFFVIAFGFVLAVPIRRDVAVLGKDRSQWSTGGSLGAFPSFFVLMLDL